LESARQDRWLGSASFRIARSGRDAVSGKPAEVTNLPVGIQKRLVQVPELLQIARIANLGEIQVRGGPAWECKLNLDPQIALGEARAMYETLRRNSAPDDIAPELFPYAALNEYQAYGDMKAVMDEILRKQSRNEDAQVLAEWVRARMSR